MSLDADGISAIVEEYEKDSKAMKEELLRICWYMRGSITYDDAMILSFDEKTIIGKLIEENMEITKKSGLPFF